MSNDQKKPGCLGCIYIYIEREDEILPSYVGIMKHKTILKKDPY